MDIRKGGVLVAGACVGYGIMLKKVHYCIVLKMYCNCGDDATNRACQLAHQKNH